MKLDERHKIEVVITPIENGMPGDIYNDFQEFRKENPYCDHYWFGFCIVDTICGCVPSGCDEWNDTVEEALYDYCKNVVLCETK